MKKYFYFLVILTVFASCEEDIKFNNPAFQTLKDNTFWRAQVYKAGTETNGFFIIEGSLGYEQIKFQLSEPAEETFALGINDDIKAIYKNTYKGQEAEFSTGTGKGNGEVVVTEYNTVDNTISGTFKFTAVNVSSDVEKQTMHFSEGVFYKIPVEPGGNFVPVSN
ncbi:DUF6252 family protein [Flavobacterium quisquiliarum]|uniref:DUF6252 family protein n=1 Tax=Flavobacterium quisquiliarum TaxID=1834436 RepID=A0ABV8WA71_9FLAO|nr:DUF6252 family protein [Flavobacterium quisquiliarum]MBW1657351.1 hypothetical protein [Flavobacterium quisquiliarum]NWL01947.1 hypothetical protein [Flavobacterium collinsii]